MPDDVPAGLTLTWQAYRPDWRRREPPTMHRAILTRREIGPDGRPVLKEVGYIASFDESRTNNPEEQGRFWWRARFRLGKLSLRQNEIALVETALSQRVPRPDPATVGQTRFKPRRRRR